MIIPTRYKSRIAHTFSYPLGAQEISEVLKHVPQYGKLYLCFSFYPMIWQRNNIPCQILGAGYGTGAQWSIRVQAVPQSLRYEIRTILIEQSLPDVALWLARNAGKEGREGYSRIGYTLSEDVISLTSEEEEKLDPVIAR